MTPHTLMAWCYATPRRRRLTTILSYAALLLALLALILSARSEG